MKVIAGRARARLVSWLCARTAVDESNEEMKTKLRAKASEARWAEGYGAGGEDR